MLARAEGERGVVETRIQTKIPPEEMNPKTNPDSPNGDGILFILVVVVLFVLEYLKPSKWTRLF